MGRIRHLSSKSIRILEIIHITRLCDIRDNFYVKSLNFEIYEKLGLRKTFLLEYKSNDGPTTIGTETAPLSPLRSGIVRSLHVAANTDTGDGLRVRSKSLRPVSHTAEVREVSRTFLYFSVEGGMSSRAASEVNYFASFIFFQSIVPGVFSRRQA